MSLKNKSFENTLYLIEHYMKDKNKIHPLLQETSIVFLKNLFKLSNKIENQDLVLFKYNSNSGFTTGMLFLMMQYSFILSDITIITLSKNNTLKRLRVVIDLFKEFYPEINKYEDKNDIKIDTKDNTCKINIIGETSFNITELKGLLFFDCNNEIKNDSKYDDIIKNIAIYNKVIMSFNENEYFNNLAKSEQTDIIDIKLK